MAATAPAFDLIDQIPALIRFGRYARRLRQLDLGRQVGVTHVYISQIETGYATPTPELLARIADVLDLPTLSEAVAQLIEARK